MSGKVIEILFGKLKAKIKKVNKLHEFEWDRLKYDCTHIKKAPKALWTKNVPDYGCEKINSGGDYGYYFCRFGNCPLIK